MYFFEKKFSLFILLISLPLLFLPKINLIHLGESETAGIRIDDIILFFLALLFIWAHALLNKRLLKIEGWILTLTMFSILSFLLNRLFVSMGLLHVNAKIFYAIRLFEYFLFFYIGMLASQFFPGNGIIKIFFFWNFLLMLLQKFNIAGGITVTGYSSDVSQRVQGIASFPSEMGLLLNLIFCYMIYDLQNYQSRIYHLFTPSARRLVTQLYLCLLFSLFGTFVIFTGNRISILALFICFLFRLKNEFTLTSIRSAIAVIFITVGIIAGSFFIMLKTESVYQRSEDLLSFNNVSLIQFVWNHIDMTQDPIGHEIAASGNYDTSWWIRIHKWVYAFKTYVTHPECYLQGIGPGFAWSALDGGLLRILTEHGLIGTFIFWNFFSIIYRLNIQLKWMMIAFLINMIFFDAYLAYKTMSFLLFTAGHIYGLETKSLKKLQNANAELSLS